MLSFVRRISNSSPSLKLKLFVVGIKICIFPETDRVDSSSNSLCLQLNESIFVLNTAASANIFECSINQLEVFECVTNSHREVIDANMILCFEKEELNTIFSSPDCSVTVRKIESDKFESKILFQPATVIVTIESLLMWGNFLSELLSFDTSQPPTQSHHRLECSLESLDVFVGLSVSSTISSVSAIPEFLALSDSCDSWKVRVAGERFFKVIAACKYGFYFTGRSITFIHSSLAALCSSEVFIAVGEIGLFVAAAASKSGVLCDPFCRVETELKGPLISISRDASSMAPTSVNFLLSNLSVGKLFLHFYFTVSFFFPP
jgi:hypothetical protein